ncbi:MAG: GGDEF domain-containing protein [Desulfovibrio sp.]|jgi:diguanylate cyclase (GGDEF)-like protein|nr:GGDEF domain-containing protein [Desulfovibrio sp.]
MFVAAGQKPFYTKVFLYIFLVFLLLMTCFGIFIYRVTGETVKRQMGKKCLGIASAVSVLIEQDADGYRGFLKTLDTQSDYYKRIKSAIESIRYANEGNIIYLYTENRHSETEMMYVLDGERADLPTFSPPGSIELLTVTRLTAYTSGSAYVGDFLIDNDWGMLLSAFVPIRDPKTGEFLGLVGADVSIDQYREVMHYQGIIVIGSIALFTLMVGAALLMSTGRVERLFSVDAMTGVYNRAFFMRSLKIQMWYAEKSDLPVIVFMADMDHFKCINDTYGHPFGDLVLEKAAGVMSRALRKTDCLARYGGEEFAGYMPGLDLESAGTIINRIRETVEETLIYNKELDKNIFVTVSIGATQITRGQTAADAVEKADKALYHAKLRRNAVAFYSEKKGVY